MRNPGRSEDLFWNHANEHPSFNMSVLNSPPFLPVWITYLQMPSIGSMFESAVKSFSAASFLELVFSRAWAISSSELLKKVSFKASISLASIAKSFK